MRTPIKALIGIVVITLALLFVNVSATQADQPETKPAPLSQIGLTAAKSLDALDAFSKQSGIPLPDAFSAASIEAQFSFIGKGGLATDKPIGIVVCGTPDLKPDQMIAFVFPMKPTAGTVESLKALGATPMPDHPDTLLLGAAGLRRTADYLIFSPTPAVAAGVREEIIEDAVNSGDALIKVTADLKAFREILPDQYKQTVASIKSNSDLAIIAGPMVKTLDTLDRVDIGLGNGEQGVALSISATPWKLPALTAVNQPGLPPNVMARLDFGVPIGDLFPWARDLLDGFQRRAAQGPDGKPLTASQKQLVDFVFSRFGEFTLEPGAMSIGAEIIAGDPVFYIVQHWNRITYASQEIQQAGDSLNLLAKENNPDSTFAFQTYVSDGVPVLRVVAVDHIKPAGALDIAQKGNNVYITIAPNQFRHIRHLMMAKEDGPIKDPMSASVDLGKAVDELSKAKDSPLAELSPDAISQIMGLVRGQTLGLSTAIDGDTVTMNFTASKLLLQSAPKLLAAFQGTGPSDADPARDAQAMTSARQLLLGCITFDNDHRIWPNTLNDIADTVGGKDALAKLLAAARTGKFIYQKPADSLSDFAKTIVLYETFADAPLPSVIVGYADGHVVLLKIADLKKELAAGAK